MSVTRGGAVASTNRNVELRVIGQSSCGEGFGQRGGATELYSKKIPPPLLLVHEVTSYGNVPLHTD